jgi:hypothetical protein
VGGAGKEGERDGGGCCSGGCRSWDGIAVAAAVCDCGLADGRISRRSTFVWREGIGSVIGVTTFVTSPRSPVSWNVTKVVNKKADDGADEDVLLMLIVAAVKSGNGTVFVVLIVSSFKLVEVKVDKSVFPATTRETTDVDVKV